MRGNIKNLIVKDLRMAVHPSTFIYFVLAPGMLFIPQYPRPIGYLYIIIAFMNMFTLDNANKDREFCGLLPVTKNECVRARVITVCLIELAMMLVTVPFCFLSNAMFNKSGIANHGGMNINLTLFAIVLIGYAIANLIIIPGGYKGNFKVTARSLIAIAVYMVVTIALENLVCRPLGGQSFLNGTSAADLARQLPILLASLAVYVIMNAVTCRIACANFEKAEI